MKLVRRICVLLILLAITIGLMSAANAHTVNSIYDTNADGKVDLLDVTQTQLWFGTDYPTCDVNDDGEVSISDMIYIANAMEGKPSADTTQPTAVLAVEDTTLATTQYTIDFDFVIEKDNQGFCFGMSDTSNFIMWQVDTFVGGDKVLLRPHFKYGGMWKGYPGQPGYNVQNVDITSAFGVSSASEVIGKTFHERIVVNGANVKTYFGAAGATADTPDSELILAHDFTYNGAASLPFNSIGFRHVDDGAGNVHEISSYDNIVVRNENGEIIFSEDFSDPDRIQITNTNSKIPYAVENGSLQVGGVDDSVNTKGEAVFKLDQLASPESFKSYTVSASNAANLATVQLRLKYSGLTDPVVEPAGEWFILTQSADNGVLDVIVCNMAGASSETDILTVSGTAASDVVLEVTEATLSAFTGDGEGCIPVDLTNATTVELVNYPAWVSGIQITNRNNTDVLGDGTVSYTPATETEAAVLTLNNANLTDETFKKYGVIYLEEDTEIRLLGTNTITGVNTKNTSTLGVYGTEEVSVTGTGALSINIFGQGAVSGIGSRKNVKIVDTTVDIVTSTTYVRGFADGISGYGILIEGSAVELCIGSGTGVGQANWGIRPIGSLEITDSTVTIIAKAATNISAGIQSTGTIKNSAVEINTGAATESVGVYGLLTVESGTVEITAQTKALSAAPNLDAYKDCLVVVGTYTTPDTTLTYDPANFASYKYFGISPKQTAPAYNLSLAHGNVTISGTNLVGYDADGSKVTIPLSECTRGNVVVTGDVPNAAAESNRFDLTVPNGYDVHITLKGIKRSGDSEGIVLRGGKITFLVDGKNSFSDTANWTVIAFGGTTCVFEGVNGKTFDVIKLQHGIRNALAGTGTFEIRNCTLAYDGSGETGYRAEGFNTSVAFTVASNAQLMDGSGVLYAGEGGTTEPVIPDSTPTPTVFQYQHSNQLGLIEPWSLKANLYLYYEDGTAVTAKELDELRDYGAYFVWADDLGSPETLPTAEEIVNCEKAVRMDKANGCVAGILPSGEGLTATYSGIATYRLNTPMYVVFFVEEDAGIQYGPVKERSLKELAAQGETNTNFTQEEKAVYTSMKAMEDTITAHRANFTNIPDIPLMDAPVVEENMFGDYKTDLSVKHSLNIVLIEPWGIKFNGYVNGDYADYGFVVSRKTSDLAEMLEDPDTHVFSLSNEDVTLRNTTLGTEISGIFNKDIYTYQMNENLYASFFVKDADGTYHFGVVKTRNILSIIEGLVQNPAHSAEHAVYQAMIDMYHAVTAFRNHAN